MRRFTLRIALLSIAVAYRAVAQTDLGTQGVRAVRVEIAASFLDTAMIRTTMELELRRAGLRVVAPRSGDPIDGSLEFSASASGMEGDGDAFHAVFARLSLWRRVYLHPSREAASTVAAVWQDEFLSTDKQDVLRESIRVQLDKLLNEWLAANPSVAARAP